MKSQSPVAKIPESQIVQQETTHGGRFYRADVDILESDSELTIYSDLPGVNAEQINISFDNGTLTIHGAVKQRQSGETKYLLQDYGMGDFHRSFQVNEDIDAEKISAECSNGVLTLHLPKAEPEKPRKIKVAAS